MPFSIGFAEWFPHSLHSELPVSVKGIILIQVGTVRTSDNRFVFNKGDDNLSK